MSYRNGKIYCGSVWREGAAVMLRFDHTGGGLRLTDGGFQLAGRDGVFRAAEARIVSEDAIRVSVPGIDAPAAVRYAWYSYGPAGLHGDTGLAAAPLNEIL